MATSSNSGSAESWARDVVLTAVLAASWAFAPDRRVVGFGLGFGSERRAIPGSADDKLTVTYGALPLRPCAF